MAKGQTIPHGKAQDAFAITPSDTLNIVADAGNVQLYAHCFVHNVATGAPVRVLPADSDVPVTIFIAQGATSDLAVKRVYASTPTAPVGLIGIITKQ
jgi:hypothetical protein